MKLVIVGKIVNTCGLKGELKVMSTSNFIEERFKKGNTLNVINENKQINEELIVSSYRINNNFIYIKLKGIDSIEKAEKYKDSSLYIDGQTLKRINEDTYYYYELLDMEVYYNDKKIGYISEMSTNGVQDLIRVDMKENSILIPFLNEFIETINVKENKIILKNIEGLL